MMHRTSESKWWATLLLALCLVAPEVQAQGSAARQALKLYKQGTVLYRAGNYREAIPRYRRSLELHPKRQTAYYLAESHRRLGQIRTSHKLYQRYMQLLPPDRRAAFGAKLTKLRWGKPCQLSVASAPGGAQVRLDGKPRGTTPADGTPLKLMVPGGRHQLALTLAGHREAGRQVEAEFGEPQALSFALEALAPAPTPVAPAPDALPAPRPVTPTPTIHRAAPAPASQPGGLFAHVTAGASWGRYGDAALAGGPSLQLSLRLGYLWRWSRLGLHADASALLQPQADSRADSTLWLVSFTAGGGARLYLWPRLWASLRLSVGISTLHGAAVDGQLFQHSTEVEGSFSTLLVRPELVLGYNVYRGLTVLLVPLALDYSPRHPDFGANVDYLLRVQAGAGVGWQW